MNRDALSPPSTPATSHGTYWVSISAATLALVMGLAAFGYVAGFDLSDLEAGTEAMVIAHVAALTCLLWPSASVTIKRLYDRKTLGWICAPLYMTTVFVFMLAYFGKPFPILSAPGPLMLMSTFMLVLLTAWLMVESVLAFDAANEPEATTVAG